MLELSQNVKTGASTEGRDSISRIRKHSMLFFVTVPFCYISAGKMQAQQAMK